MGTKITKYPNMKILPNDGIKFKCGCGCEFTAFGQSLLVDCDCLGGKLEIYYAHCHNKSNSFRRDNGCIYISYKAQCSHFILILFFISFGDFAGYE